VTVGQESFIDNDGTLSIEELTSFFDILARAGIDFTGADGELPEDRIQTLADQSAAGGGDTEILQGLLDEAFAQNPEFNKGPDDAARIAGEVTEGRSLDNLVVSLARIVGELPEHRLDTVIPDGATLLRVDSPTGSATDAIYYLRYNVLGSLVTFEIGDQLTFDELFPEGANAFSTSRVLTQAQFDAAGAISLGSVSEVIGQTETLDSQIGREISALGLTAPPAWIMGSEEAKKLIVFSTQEGWSSNRLWTELAKTDAFGARFPGVDTFLLGDTTIEAAVDEYLSEETALLGAIRRYRPGESLSNQDIGDVLANGWTSATFAAALELEQQITHNPNALVQLNDVLVASGFDPTDELGLLQVMTDSAPLDITEALNTASASIALSEAGFDGVDIDGLVDIIDDVSGFRTPESYAKLAQELALTAVRNRHELDIGKFDITDEDLVSVFFGEESPTGTGSGEILNRLARFERDRRAASSGFGGAQASIGRQGLQLQGFGGQ